MKILVERLPEAVEKLKKLEKKVTKYGQKIQFTVGKPYIEKRQFISWDGSSTYYNVNVCDVTVDGDAPRVGDYEFLGRVEITKAGNLIMSVPFSSHEIDDKFRSTNGYCDHCKIDRNRKDVFIVRDAKTGQQLQVGRTCLRDFIGIDNPEAAISSIFSVLKQYRDEMGEYEGYHNIWSIPVHDLLSLSSVMIKLFGWKGKKNTDYGDFSTSNRVKSFLDKKPVDDEDRAYLAKIRNALTDEDKETATKTIEWIRNYNGKITDYMHNLMLFMKDDIITNGSHIGFIVSAVYAYQRQFEQKEQSKADVSRHVGTVKERINGLKVTLISQREIETSFGISTLVKFVTEEGNKLSWFTSSCTGKQIGEKLIIDATIKGHSEYNGVKETKVTRVKIK